MKVNTIRYLVAGLIIVVVVALVIGMNANNNDDSMQSMNIDSSDNNKKAAGEYADFLGNANIGATKDESSKKDVVVSIDDFIFKTTILTVSKDTKVTWTNNGKISHNVVSSDDSDKKGLDGDLLTNGESYSYMFDETGTYHYLCTPHPTQMRGVVIVK